MVRKSKKGIVGKALPTMSKRYRIGKGLDFVKERLLFGDEIERKSRD